MHFFKISSLCTTVGSQPTQKQLSISHHLLIYQCPHIYALRSFSFGNYCTFKKESYLCHNNIWLLWHMIVMFNHFKFKMILNIEKKKHFLFENELPSWKFPDTKRIVGTKTWGMFISFHYFTFWLLSSNLLGCMLVKIHYITTLLLSILCHCFISLWLWLIGLNNKAKE